MSKVSVSGKAGKKINHPVAPPTKHVDQHDRNGQGAPKKSPHGSTANYLTQTWNVFGLSKYEPAPFQSLPNWIIIGAVGAAVYFYMRS